MKCYKLFSSKLLSRCNITKEISKKGVTKMEKVLSFIGNFFFCFLCLGFLLLAINLLGYFGFYFLIWEIPTFEINDTLSNFIRSELIVLTLFCLYLSIEEEMSD